jgi:hypothetical protein
MPNARTVGIVYLVYFVLAISAGLVAPHLGTHDAATLRATLSSHETSFAMARALDVFATGIYLAVVVLLTSLLTPVAPMLARIAQAYGTAGCTIQIGAGLLRLAPVTIYHLAPTAVGLSDQQLNGLAFALFDVSAQGQRVALVFFGLFCVCLGTLVIRSTFAPQVLGGLLILAGAGWLTFLWPSLAQALSNVVLPFGFVAELLLMVWLLLKGVRLPPGDDRAP